MSPLYYLLVGCLCFSTKLSNARRDFSSSRREIPIGVLLTEDDYESEAAVLSAVKYQNMNTREIELIPIVKYLSEVDSYKAGELACELISEGVAAIFGPSSPHTAPIVASIANTYEIPHIVVYWSAVTQENHEMTINMYPDSAVLAQALVDLVTDYDWTTFTIIYDDDESLIRLKDVIQKHGPNDLPITVRQIDDNPDQRPLLKEIHNTSESRIILDVHSDRVMQILRQAAEVKLIGTYVSYIIVDLDTHAVDFEEFYYSETNITSIRLVHSDHDELYYMSQMWRQHSREMKQMPVRNHTLPALFNDAVKLFMNVFMDIDSTEKIYISKFSCDAEEKWIHGKSIIEFMKKKEETGITGTIGFNDFGERNVFDLEIIELSKTGFSSIGTWDPHLKVQYTRTTGEVEQKIQQSLHNRTLIVASRLGRPYLVEKTPQKGEILEGNARFDGYSLRLIDEISKVLGFKYIFELVPDGKYGSFDKTTKKWDGLIKQLLDRKADLAICDLTITYSRRTAVDFSMPFMNLGISILYSKTKKEPPSLFSFLMPFSTEVWVYTMTAYLGVSLLLFFLARMAPGDWENPHPCKKDNNEVENIWSILNSVWLTMGSIMGQGCDILPKSVSTRLVSGMWWFFALIMLASYTANLAAFLTMDRMEESIKSVEDLAKQTKIKYGTLEGGSTFGFFKDSNHSLYQRMWAAMESSKPTVFTKDNKEGMERVLKGNFAYFMESTSIEYEMERNCDLMQVGSLLDSKSYGIAMPMNSPFRSAINRAVLKLQEEGKLQTIKNEYWKPKDEEILVPCEEDSSAKSSDAELGLANVGGVFIVLVIGLACAFIIGILDFLWNVRALAVENKISQKEALRGELKFIVNFWITTKPINTAASESDTIDNGDDESKLYSRKNSESISHKIKAISLTNLNKIEKLFNK